MPKGVIYDLDDLMVNSDPLHLEAWNILLKEYGHSFDELPAHAGHSFIGMRVSDILKEIAEHFKLEVEFDVLYRKRTSIFLELVKKKLQPMPGLFVSLEFFKKNKFKIAMASSGAKKYIDLVLKKFKLSGYFDVIVTGDDVKHGKPNPEIFLLASKKLRLNPKDTVVLEDATKGVEAAKSAGCKCVAVFNLNTPAQDHSKADKIINSLSDIDIDLVNSF